MQPLLLLLFILSLLAPVLADNGVKVNVAGGVLLSSVFAWSAYIHPYFSSGTTSSVIANDTYALPAILDPTPYLGLSSPAEVEDVNWEDWYETPPPPVTPAHHIFWPTCDLNESISAPAVEGNEFVLPTKQPWFEVPRSICEGHLWFLWQIIRSSGIFVKDETWNLKSAFGALLPGHNSWLWSTGTSLALVLVLFTITRHLVRHGLNLLKSGSRLAKDFPWYHLQSSLIKLWVPMRHLQEKTASTFIATLTALGVWIPICVESACKAFTMIIFGGSTALKTFVHCSIEESYHMLARCIDLVFLVATHVIDLRQVMTSKALTPAQQEEARAIARSQLTQTMIEIRGQDADDTLIEHHNNLSRDRLGWLTPKIDQITANLCKDFHGDVKTFIQQYAVQSFENKIGPLIQARVDTSTERSCKEVKELNQVLYQRSLKDLKRDIARKIGEAVADANAETIMANLDTRIDKAASTAASHYLETMALGRYRQTVAQARSDMNRQISAMTADTRKACSDSKREILNLKADAIQNRTEVATLSTKFETLSQEAGTALKETEHISVKQKAIERRLLDVETGKDATCTILMRQNSELREQQKVMGVTIETLRQQIEAQAKIHAAGRENDHAAMRTWQDFSLKQIEEMKALKKEVAVLKARTKKLSNMKKSTTVAIPGQLQEAIIIPDDLVETPIAPCGEAASSITRSEQPKDAKQLTQPNEKEPEINVPSGDKIPQKGSEANDPVNPAIAFSPAARPPAEEPPLNEFPAEFVAQTPAQETKQDEKPKEQNPEVEKTDRKVSQSGEKAAATATSDMLLVNFDPSAIAKGLVEPTTSTVTCIEEPKATCETSVDENHSFSTETVIAINDQNQPQPDKLTAPLPSRNEKECGLSNMKANGDSNSDNDATVLIEHQSSPSKSKLAAATKQPASLPEQQTVDTKQPAPFKFDCSKIAGMFTAPSPEKPVDPSVNPLDFNAVAHLRRSYKVDKPTGAPIGNDSSTAKFSVSQQDLPPSTPTANKYSVIPPELSKPRLVLKPRSVLKPKSTKPSTEEPQTSRARVPFAVALEHAESSGLSLEAPKQTVGFESASNKNQEPSKSAEIGPDSISAAILSNDNIQQTDKPASASAQPPPAVCHVLAPQPVPTAPNVDDEIVLPPGLSPTVFRFHHTVHPNVPVDLLISFLTMFPTGQKQDIEVGPGSYGIGACVASWNQQYGEQYGCINYEKAYAIARDTWGDSIGDNAMTADRLEGVFALILETTYPSLDIAPRLAIMARTQLYWATEGEGCNAVLWVGSNKNAGGLKWWGLRRNDKPEYHPQDTAPSRLDPDPTHHQSPQPLPPPASPPTPIDAAMSDEPNISSTFTACHQRPKYQQSAPQRDSPVSPPLYPADDDQAPETVVPALGGHVENDSMSDIADLPPDHSQIRPEEAGPAFGLGHAPAGVASLSAAYDENTSMSDIADSPPDQRQIRPEDVEPSFRNNDTSEISPMSPKHTQITPQDCHPSLDDENLSKISSLSAGRRQIRPEDVDPAFRPSSPCYSASSDCANPLWGNGLPGLGMLTDDQTHSYNSSSPPQNHNNDLALDATPIPDASLGSHNGFGDDDILAPYLKPFGPDDAITHVPPPQSNAAVGQPKDQARGAFMPSVHADPTLKLYSSSIQPGVSKTRVSKSETSPISEETNKSILAAFAGDGGKDDDQQSQTAAVLEQHVRPIDRKKLKPKSRLGLKKTAITQPTPSLSFQNPGLNPKAFSPLGDPSQFMGVQTDQAVKPQKEGLQLSLKGSGYGYQADVDADVDADADEKARIAAEAEAEIIKMLLWEPEEDACSDAPGDNDDTLAGTTPERSVDLRTETLTEGPTETPAEAASEVGVTPQWIPTLQNFANPAQAQSGGNKPSPTVRHIPAKDEVPDCDPDHYTPPPGKREPTDWEKQHLSGTVLLKIRRTTGYIPPKSGDAGSHTSDAQLKQNLRHQAQVRGAPPP